MILQAQGACIIKRTPTSAAKGNSLDETSSLTTQSCDNERYIYLHEMVDFMVLVHVYIYI